LIDRRAFLGASLAFLLSPAGLARALDRQRALATSGLVYVSPLHSDGRESTCHGEVWFAWLDDAVVVITARDRWKARAILRGLTRARLWVGDHGPWKRVVGRSEAFRQAPSFDARAEIVEDGALLDRLLAEFDRKYPDEIGKWRDRMRREYADGTRHLIRYTPLP
jgi:hypothetical protein